MREKQNEPGYYRRPPFGLSEIWRVRTGDSVVAIFVHYHCGESHFSGPGFYFS